MKACARNVRIDLLGFGNNIFATNIDGPKFSCLYFQFLLLLCFFFLSLFLICLSFAFDEFLDLLQFLFGCSEMMVRTLVRALIFLLFIFSFVLFNSFLDFADLLLFVFEIRLVSYASSALNPTLTLIRSMIPFVIWFKLSLLLLLPLLSHSQHSKFQLLQVQLYHLLQFLSLQLLAFLKLFSFIQILSCSILCYLQIVVDG